jgi:hypothetical protein
MKDKFDIKEGREIGNQKHIKSSRPIPQPAPQICYKSDKPCLYNCSGLCKDSY